MKAARVALEEGRVVAAATESSFGLFADATQPRALHALFAAKPRAAGVALVIPNRRAWLDLVIDIPELAERLADAFWPGPLTIALPARAGVDPRLTVEGTVGVRLPGASPAAALATAYGRPLTATSANPHGRPPATSDDEVATYFAPLIEAGGLVVLPGTSPGGAPSTVAVIREGRLTLARSGAISDGEIRAAIGNAVI